MSVLEKMLDKFPVLNKVVEWAETVRLPGFDNVPLYDVVVFFVNEIKRDVINVRAKSIAYTFFLALFPSVLFLFTLIPYIPVDNLQENLVALIKELLPDESIFKIFEQTITGVVVEQRGGLLSIGLLMTLFFSTNGVLGIMESFDKSYSTFKKRNILRKRWVALKLTIVLFFLLILSIVLIVAGNQILEFLLSTFDIFTPLTFILFNTLKWLIILLLFFNSISFIYYYGPATKKKFKFISAGSTLATILAILISIGFSYFISNFATYNKIYGSIGTIIALLVYIYLNSFALLIGFELNASIAYNKNLRLEREADEDEE